MSNILTDQKKKKRKKKVLFLFNKCLRSIITRAFAQLGRVGGGFVLLERGENQKLIQTGDENEIRVDVDYKLNSVLDQVLQKSLKNIVISFLVPRYFSPSSSFSIS